MFHSYLLYTFAEFKFKSNHVSYNVNKEWLKFRTFFSGWLTNCEETMFTPWERKKKANTLLKQTLTQSEDPFTKHLMSRMK